MKLPGRTLRDEALEEGQKYVMSLEILGNVSF